MRPSRPSPVFSFAASLSLTLLHAAPARAGGVVEGEIAVKGGFTLANDIGPETPFGPGGGGRAGVSVHGIYAGVAAAYSKGNMDAALIQGGFEAGYGFRLLGDRLTLRPVVGLGSAAIPGSGRVEPAGAFGGQAEASSKFLRIGQGFLYVEPSIACLYALGPTWFVGGDVGILVIPDALSDSASYGWSTLVAGEMHVQLGIRF